VPHRAADALAPDRRYGDLYLAVGAWNTCGAYMAATLGVAIIAYLPNCFFDLINPVLSFIFDAIGFQIKLLTAEKTGETELSELEKIDHYGVGGYEVDPAVEA
jgi:hypothetical protein